MAEFYPLLRAYNRSAAAIQVNVGWQEIYQADHPPKYWRTIADIAKHWPRDFYCVEIGSGLGDVLALLLHLGFSNVCGFERDARLAEAANQKLAALFGRSSCVVAGDYPVKLAQRPKVLLQVNCCYMDGVVARADFVDRLRRWYSYNGVPDVYLLEVVDASFRATHASFPMQLRLGEADVQGAFPGCRLERHLTYTYPQNTSTKYLYEISSPKEAA